MKPLDMETLARGWRRAVLMRELLLATFAGCVAAIPLLPWTSLAMFGSAIVFCGVLGLRLGVIRPWRSGVQELARRLNRLHPELEESSALWLRAPEHLTLVERLQLRRLDAAHARRTKNGSQTAFGVPPPGFLRVAGWLCFAGVAGLLSMAIGVAVAARHDRLHRQATLRQIPSGGRPDSVAAPVKPPPRIVAAKLRVSPPPYTGKPTRESADLNAEVEEGAAVEWTIKLDQPVENLRIFFGQGDAGALVMRGGLQDGYKAGVTAGDSALYHLAAVLPGGGSWTPPQVYSLKVVKDRPPAVAILQPLQVRTEAIPPPPGGPAVKVRVEVDVTDDYAVASAEIVATVAKGSGESVKFREQRIPFDGEDPGAGPAAGAASRRFTKTLDLSALGMEPGDELYFYAEAADNRLPVPNRTRSETRFVVLKGAETKATSSGRGIAGVNLVPQYFRSERQIIIDTEKLIADRAAMSAEEFRRRSNDLGIDQQLLRLRYGQFLGEELEEGQGAGDHEEVNLNPLQNGVPKDMIHQHDTVPQGSSGGADPQAAAHTELRLQLEHAGQAEEHDGDDSTTNHGAPPDAAQVIAPFVDEHDKQDVATYFDREAKGTMRDALAAMWEAEGFLRTIRPDEALAPANKALTILKDVQQSARAYVQHVGFEPAPLKVDNRRLKGDVADVLKELHGGQSRPADDPGRSTLRSALATIPWSDTLGVLDPVQVDLLIRAEPALTAAATRDPGAYLKPLQTLRMLTARRSRPGANAGAELAGAMLRLLPASRPEPILGRDLEPELSERYFQALDKTEKAR